MFQIVRHWWGGGRGKATAGLFLFELTVVVIGVLIAQALAGYAQRRSDLARMESERSRIRYELTTIHSTFQSWQAGLPCLDRRMTEIMAGKPFSADALRRPRLPSLGYNAPTTDVLDLIAEHYGIEEKTRLNRIAVNTGNSSAVLATIIARWGRLLLIDPANGVVTAADRVEARLAAADIKAQLRAMDVLSSEANGVLTKMGIAARNQTEPGYGPARSCAAIWNSGRLNPLLASP